MKKSKKIKTQKKPKTDAAKKWVTCGLCHGRGRHTEYGETWECPPCSGSGGFWAN